MEDGINGLRQRKKPHLKIIYTGPYQSKGKSDGFIYNIPIWCQIPASMKAKVLIGEEAMKVPMGNSAIIPYKEEGDGTVSALQVLERMGTSKEEGNLKFGARETVETCGSRVL